MFADLLEELVEHLFSGFLQQCYLGLLLFLFCTVPPGFFFGRLTMSVGRSVSNTSSLYPGLRFSCPYAFVMTFPSFSLTRRFGMPYFPDSFVVYVIVF